MVARANLAIWGRWPASSIGSVVDKNQLVYESTPMKREGGSLSDHAFPAAITIDSVCLNDIFQKETIFDPPEIDAK